MDVLLRRLGDRDGLAAGMRGENGAMKPRRIALLAFAFVFSTALAQTDEVRATIASIQRLLIERPDEPTLYYYLAAFQAL